MFDLDLDFDFDGFQLDFDIQDDTSNTFCKPKICKPKKVIYDNAVKMANEIELEKDMSIYAIVSGNFIFGDLLEALIVEKQLKTKSLSISTLSLSQDNVDSMANIMYSGLCDELHLIVSSYFYSHERHVLIPYIYDELEKEKPWDFRLSVAGSHMKIALIETDNLKLTIQGSANLRSSRSVEQFSMIDDQELFDFNKKYIEIIEKTYQINKKSGERGGKLWQSLENLQTASEKR
jgi:hypothetical protein